METIRQLALRRLGFLGVCLFAGLNAAVYGLLKGELPAQGFGIVLLLLMVAFLTGLSLTLRATSRQLRRHLTQTVPATAFTDATAETANILTVLRGK